VGVVVASFLFGMNFVKQSDNNYPEFSRNEALQQNRNNSDLFKNSIPALPSENDEIMTPLEDKKIMNNSEGISGSTAVLNSKNETGSTDVLTNENIAEIISPPQKIKKATARAAVKNKKTFRAVAKKTVKPVRKKTVVRSPKRRSRVVEVASAEGSVQAVRKSGYSIQVASYDKKSKASSEIQKLNSMKYDAFVDRTTVRGKRYFRVRIGPVASKKKAIDLLENIQGNPRYEGSYMIKQ